MSRSKTFAPIAVRVKNFLLPVFQAYGHPAPSVRWRHVAFGHSAGAAASGGNGAGSSSLLLQLHAGTLGEPLEEVAGVRRLLPNGTLALAPFGSAQARFHAGVVQCVAQNDVGSVVSRDVHLRGGASGGGRGSVPKMNSMGFIVGLLSGFRSYANFLLQ